MSGQKQLLLIEKEDDYCRIKFSLVLLRKCHKIIIPQATDCNLVKLINDAVRIKKKFRSVPAVVRAMHSRVVSCSLLLAVLFFSMLMVRI